MISTINKLIKSALCLILLLILLLHGTPVKAQVLLIQNTIDKLKLYKNFSYEYTNKRVDYTIDTTIIHSKGSFLKVPADTAIGYYFKLESGYETERLVKTELYDGKNHFYLLPEKRTFEVLKVKPSIMDKSVLGELNWIRNFAEKKPHKLARVSDTTINGVTNMHLILTTRDTIIEKQYYYTFKHLLLNKLSGMPFTLITTSRYDVAGVVTNYYNEIRYSDYKFNQPGINAAAFTVPRGYQHVKKSPPPPPLLVAGTEAPNWILLDAHDNRMSLSQLKGKVVLLNFYFIGCSHSMASLKTMKALHQKYKDRNFAIASISDRDKKKAILAFQKRYNIDYASYINDGAVVKSYQVSGFPTFYFIDKEGRVAQVVEGYKEGFEAKAAVLIDSLLTSQ